MDPRAAMKLKLRYLVNKFIFRVNYRKRNYSEVIWLIGDGRSGTTWASELINHDKSYRSMFEPFHPKVARFFRTNQYMRPDGAHKKLENLASRVFSGKFSHLRTDQGNWSLKYRGMIIKDIFANLFSYWASIKFPHVKIILLIRNPFAVALSKEKMKGGIWTKEPLDLLNQDSLYDDFLHPFEDLIRKTSREKDFILKQILIWSILHYVPLRQFRKGQIHIMFYENLYRQPADEIARLFRFVKPANQRPKIEIDPILINLPSRVSGSKSNIVLMNNPTTSWKDETSPQKFDAGYGILHSFGLDKLYNLNAIPDKSALLKFSGHQDVSARRIHNCIE